ncbi:MAG: hypothetical protein K0R67_1763 [Paenibacillus sp.]|nr:hypothetical protein [Paenibacillus sp.]
MNRSLLNLLALIELVLAVLFAVVCLIVFIVQPDSLTLQLLLAFIGIAGVLNGFYLIRRIKLSRTPAARKVGNRPAPNQKAKRPGGKK